MSDSSATSNRTDGVDGQDLRPPKEQNSHLPQDNEPELDSVKDILLARERERIAELEAVNETLRDELTQLRTEQHDTERTIAHIKPVMGDLVGRTIRDSPDDMAEALGPVMGEAIRVQIRDSRDDMVEALHPVIGATVQRSVIEALREFQRNIDARLKQTFGFRGFLRQFSARLRGIDPAELALRDAIPFSIDQIFLVHRESGLLMMHAQPGGATVLEADLISSMLTAIRDFVRDSFNTDGRSPEVEEIQYGRHRIMLQDGSAAYAAVVIEGTEPEGFRGVLRDFVSELHIRYERQLRAFDGDPDTLPYMQTQVAQFVSETMGLVDEEERISPLARAVLTVLAALAILGCVALTAFYVLFTVNLFPVAFPDETETPTSTATATVTATSTVTSTATSTATATATSTATLTATSMPDPTATDIPPTATPPPVARVNVWVFEEPNLTAPTLIVYAGTPMIIIEMVPDWAQIEWTDEAGSVQNGWVPLRWIDFPE